MIFNPQDSKIAITLSELTLLETSEPWFDSYSEPYILSVAIDSTGNANPEISFNFMPFPKVRRKATVTMLGDGHLLYGPKNPGEFVALSILIMESDADMQERGRIMKELVESKAVELGLKAIILSNPGSAAIVGVLKELTSFIAGVLSKNGDDELFRLEGSFLRDQPNPYHINRIYTQLNEFVKVSLKIIPLDTPNGEGALVQKLKL
ncbi:hypothetical protein [Aeromonas hydrophila]|uniref:hypothetical protein n=1 Tax=Aeromonas hydrophila TaxID=644 RepID=UPI00191F3CA4|nr:hypothetical protein [Aeromonas hydrophila]MBL0570263.1 hypothetical protein [Aeromonas hydrophila]